MDKFIKILKNKWFFYSLLLISMIIKFFPYGLTYFTYQDDNNQYGIYHLYTGNAIKNFFIDGKLYSFRPLAGLLDIAVISKFWDNLWIVVLVMVFLHFFTIVLIDKIFEMSKISWSYLACIIFGLYPLLPEATYWISASSRLVPGLFSLCLSIYLTLLFVGNKNKKPLPLIIFAQITCLLAQGFYEQTIAFSLFFYLYILWFNRDKIVNKLIYLIPISSFIFIGGYYFAFRNVGFLSKRSELASESIFVMIKKTLIGIKNIFTLEHIPILNYTIKKGVLEIATGQTLIFILIILISILLSICLYYNINENYKPKTSLFMAFIVFTIPFSPFFVLSNSFLYLRNIYISVIGLALLGQIIWNLLHKNKYLRVGISILSAIIIFVFTISNIMGVKSYKIIEKYNISITNSILKEIYTNHEHSTLNDYEGVVILNVRYSYEEIPAQHVASALLADWSLTGQAEVLGDSPFPYRDSSFFLPIISGQPFSYDISDNNYIIIGIDNIGNAHELYSKDNILYTTNDNTPFGEFTVQENNSFIFQAY